MTRWFETALLLGATLLLLPPSATPVPRVDAGPPARVAAHEVTPVPVPPPDLPLLATAAAEPDPPAAQLPGVTTPAPQVSELEFPDVVAAQPSVHIVAPTAPGHRAGDVARRTVPGTVHAEVVELGELHLDGQPTAVAAVDPETFRALTPEITANHAPLWRRVAAGDIALTHEVGAARGLALGVELPVRVRPDSATVGRLRLGAFATNGTPPIAEAIVSIETARELGLRGEPVVVVALDAATSPQVAADQLVAALGGHARVIEDPRRPSATYVPQGQITPDNVWDHLAGCESSGNWNINTGNGYYGGLQFLPESWWAVGGSGLPHEHSREEQIYRATLLWQMQGWEAWPQCARKLGLIAP